MASYIIIEDFDTRDLDKCYIGDDFSYALQTAKYFEFESFGKDGYTRSDVSAYAGFEREFIAYVKRKEKSKFIKNCYPGKKAKFRFSNETYFYVGVVENIELEYISSDYVAIGVMLKLQPFAREAFELILDDKFVNLGDTDCLPILEIVGNGDVSILIGDEVLRVNIDTSITIDCDNLEILDHKGNKANSRRLEGDFFRVKAGENRVRLEGSYTSIGVRGDWRFYDIPI